ncbi:glycosyltransferase [Nocardia transvalensis]|uniref:glycosyltransferase n=1 Tax=Nocardia transvalensis TaxID=37333 RepID=UPI0018957574|nr:glycosyltransferase [Nocardia transvalensis]MBF6328122.1 glycosyltransferase family 1 protein [Nocardia transvalensis]
MAKILAFTSPAEGHLYPITPVLAELAARGHQITAVTLPGAEGSLPPGIAVRPLPPALAEAELDDWDARGRVTRLRAAVRTLVGRMTDEVEALQAAIAAEDPDALLIDVSAPGAQIYAAASGLPWASWAPMLLPLPSRGVPPYGPGLVPIRGPLGRLRDSALQCVIDHYWDEVLPELNRMRVWYGLSPLRHTVDYFRQPPLQLNFTAPPFDDVRRDWPDSIRQIGPGLWAPTAPRPDWLDAIDRPLALVTCSNEFHNDGMLAQVAMDALVRSKLYTVVTSGAIDPSTFRVPPNARVERFLPHHLLLDRAAVVVSHGGMGITQKALAAGVPVCVVPFGRDQYEVARRVVGNEAGVWVSKNKLTPQRLHAGVEAAMACRPGAARVAAGFAAAGGVTRGADLLEQHLVRVPVARPAHAGSGTVGFRPPRSAPVITASDSEEFTMPDATRASGGELR